MGHQRGYAGERDFDNVALIWRPELYLGKNPPPLPDRLDKEKQAEANAAWWRRRDAVRGKAELILAKNRMGPTGAVWLDFDGPRTRFNAAAPNDRQQDIF